jgi:hypothetical protein
LVEDDGGDDREDENLNEHLGIRGCFDWLVAIPI